MRGDHDARDVVNCDEGECRVCTLEAALASERALAGAIVAACTPLPMNLRLTPEQLAGIVVAIDRWKTGTQVSEREGIARYFEHLAQQEIGAVDLTGLPARELYGMVASWVRNGLDKKWAAEVRAHGGTR